MMLEGDVASGGTEEGSLDSTIEPTKKEEEFRKLVLKEISSIRLQIAQVRKDIQYSIAPQFLEMSIQAEDLVELAIELWRMENKINKILPSVTKEQQESLVNSLNKLKRYLEKNDIEIVDHTNQKYEEGENLEILAVEKDPNIAEMLVKDTKEPTILHKGEVIHIGKVIVVGKAEE